MRLIGEGRDKLLARPDETAPGGEQYPTRHIADPAHIVTTDRWRPRHDRHRLPGLELLLGGLGETEPEPHPAEKLDRPFDVVEVARVERAVSLDPDAAEAGRAHVGIDIEFVAALVSEAAGDAVIAGEGGVHRQHV